MGKELAIVEPLALPDLARGKMPSLPAWAERSRAGLGTNLQIVHGTFMEVRTLPQALLPNAAQREAMESHIRSLNLSFTQIPEAKQDWALRTAEAATKLVMTLGGGDKRSEIASEAKGEAYIAALDDVPCWAVEAAARAWYRGECGTDEKGKPYDYKWAPDPATLRKLAQKQAWMVKARINEIQEVLDAKPYVDCSAELEKGKAAMKGLRSTIATGGFDALYGLSFDQAAELGRSVDEVADAVPLKTTEDHDVVDA